MFNIFKYISVAAILLILSGVSAIAACKSFASDNFTHESIAQAPQCPSSMELSGGGISLMTTPVENPDAGSWRIIRSQPNINDHHWLCQVVRNRNARGNPVGDLVPTFKCYSVCCDPT